MLRNSKFNITTLFIFAVSAALVLQLYFTPYSGDDWVYFGAYSGYKSVCHNAWEWLKLGFGHWLGTNGRFANIGLTPLLLLPKWLLAGLCGMAAYMMYSKTVFFIDEKKSLPVTVIVVTILVTALPWWDSMMVFDCEFNYVFSSAMCLTAVNLLFKTPGNRLRYILSAAFCFVAGMMHEAASMPLLCGVAVYIYFGGKRPDNRLLWSFAAGTFIVTFSPGIWLRASHLSEPDDILPLLLLKSDALSLLLAGGIFYSLLREKMRVEVKKYSSSIICIFAVASLVSMAMSGVSGIVGRSGWFAEIYALIVITYFAKEYLLKIPKVVYTLPALTVLVHVSMVVYGQRSAGIEYAEFDRKYLNSKSGIVFIDYTRDDERSAFLLNKVRGVPDPDDTYLLKTYAEHYSETSPKPIVLPSDAKKYLEAGLNETVVLKSGDILSTVCPKLSEVRDDGLMLCEKDGVQMVVQEFCYDGKQYYHISKRILDPGDR